MSYDLDNYLEDILDFDKSNEIKICLYPLNRFDEPAIILPKQENNWHEINRGKLSKKARRKL